MEFHRKKWRCILLILFLLCLALVPTVFLSKKQPQGEYITIKEVQVLTELLGRVGEANEMIEAASSWEDGNLTYGQLKEWLGGTFSQSDELGEMDGRYQNSFYLLKEDWYRIFDQLCEKIDSQGRIERRELLILGDSARVKDIEGNPIGENQLLSDNGLWENKLPFNEELLQRRAEYITFEGALWGLVNRLDEGELENVWLVDNSEEGLIYFYHNHEVTPIVTTLADKTKEQVADLTFKEGILDGFSVKSERISGQVLKLTDTIVEIKGEGTFTLDDSVQYYRLYDRLETVGRNSIRIGYNFADFVVQEGRIQAGLLVKDEKMENIRVLLKNSGLDGYYHEVFECYSDVDMELTAGEESVLIEAGETFRLDANSEYFADGRVFLQPAALTGRIFISSIERNNQGQGYHGSIELEKRQEGIVVINEVLLEEYLYAVVPSEMPGYYPLEALKAQAVCARTYAYNKMVNSSLSSWGAHLDDSASFQVYNNIQENVNTTKAVKETRGLLLYYQEELATPYYYSTSGGFGTNDALWNINGESVIPYLHAREMTQGEASFQADALMEEEIFRQYIDAVHPGHFEHEEAWYRWTYEHDKTERILENLRSRQENYPSDILVSTDGNDFAGAAVPDEFKLKDIVVNRRGMGGCVEELLFIGDEAQILVKKELNIRAVLTDGESRVTLQDGSTYACNNLLPSSFFYIETAKEGEELTSLSLHGGGFGHGVGMSQNGAKRLANLGLSFQDILTFYYTDCQVKEG